MKRSQNSQKTAAFWQKDYKTTKKQLRVGKKLTKQPRNSCVLVKSLQNRKKHCRFGK
jgi:hypothetical protein